MLALYTCHQPDILNLKSKFTFTITGKLYSVTMHHSLPWNTLKLWSLVYKASVDWRWISHLLFRITSSCRKILWRMITSEPCRWLLCLSNSSLSPPWWVNARVCCELIDGTPCLSLLPLTRTMSDCRVIMSKMTTTGSSQSLTYPYRYSQSLHL